MLCEKCQEAVREIGRDLADEADEHGGYVPYHIEESALKQMDLIQEQCDQLGGDDCKDRPNAA
jgi:hypothetical protein